MSLVSILFATEDGYSVSANEPPSFRDLNLDQIVEEITAGRERYDLKPFFHVPLRSVDEIQYRQEIMRDLDREPVIRGLEGFAQDLRLMWDRIELTGKMYHSRQKEGWFLEAVGIYCRAVARLAEELPAAAPASRGLQEFSRYLADHVQSEAFLTLGRQTNAVKEALSAVEYSVTVKGDSFTVRKDMFPDDYSVVVGNAFSRFDFADIRKYDFKFPDDPKMNGIEEKILDFVVLLYPEEFSILDEFYKNNIDFMDINIKRFEREIQFYISYKEFISRFKGTRLELCYPQVCEDKDIASHGAFDMALAARQVKEQAPVVTNDFFLTEGERLIIVSGPNQGGKTTFARMFGQLHYLACLGCPVAGRMAKLLLFDQLHTHFERQESVSTLRGKLEDELIRMHNIIEKAGPRSIVIINEIFASTTLHDGIVLGRATIRKLIDLDLLGVCVTFIDELATLPKTVSMVSTVDPEDPAVRTFKIVRRPADGRAYAQSLARKYGLTRENLLERISP